MTCRARLMPIVAALGGVFLVSVAEAAARLDVYDRASGTVLPVYEHHGRSYVAGEPGHEYEIRVHSTNPQRMLAVTSVDGVNVVTGKTASPDQSGYVLDPYGFVRIEGWRKNMTRTAAFYFTRLSDSYAARTGRPDNVGVIGVALFSEQQRCCDDELLSRRDEQPSQSAAAAEASAPERSRSQDASKRLGTGHGRSEYSSARYTQFERASQTPDETLVIYYDSRRNLIAQGIIPATARYADRMPQPFLDGFVPDP